MDNIFAYKDMICTIYKEQSFSKAARNLFISQPSLSVIVKKIEESIGEPLFDRSFKPIRLTPAGEAYIKAAMEIKGVEDDFYNYISSIHSVEAGTLNLGSNQLLSSFVLPGYVARFVTEYPKVKLNLVNASSPSLDSALSSGDLDLVVDTKYLDPEQYENEKLTEEHLLLAVPSDLPCNTGMGEYMLSLMDVLEGRIEDVDVPDLKVFKDTTFILMTKDNDTRERSDAMFSDAGYKPRVLLEVDRLVTLYNYLETGVAAAVVSDTLMKSFGKNRGGKSMVFYRLPDSHSRRDIVMSYKKNKYLSKAMAAMMDILREFD